jgi:hypothetical protein
MLAWPGGLVSSWSVSHGAGLVAGGQEWGATDRTLLPTSGPESVLSPGAWPEGGRGELSPSRSGLSPGRSAPG